MPSVSKKQAKLAPAMLMNASRDEGRGRRRTLPQIRGLMRRREENSNSGECDHRKLPHQRAAVHFWASLRLPPQGFVMAIVLHNP
jgi:hypothetical protein